MRPIYLALVAVAVVLTSCSSGGKDRGAATTRVSCALAPAGLVSEHIGVPVDARPAAADGNVATCLYDTSDGNQLAVRLLSSVSPDDFAREKERFRTGGGPVTGVPGVGDEAFSASVTILGTTTNSVAARKGDVEVLVSAKVPVDKLRNLTAGIVSRL
jgi:hypothetical protein